MLVLEGYGMLVPSRPKYTQHGVKGTMPISDKRAMPKPKPLRCPDGSPMSKQGCKPKPPMQRPKPFKIPTGTSLIAVRPAKPAVMVKPSSMPDTALTEKAKVEVTPETKAPIITKPKQEGPSIATMAMVGIPLAVITYFMAT